MAELVSISGIAEAFDVDRSTAHYWTTREWFPEPVQRARRRGQPTLYDIEQVRRARRNYLNRKRRGPGRPPRGRNTNAS